MSRFDQEWAVVPVAARWIAALAGLSVSGLTAALWILPLLLQHHYRGLLFALPFFALALFGAAVVAVYVLLVGYVYGDARRRAMSHVIWTLIALLVPNGIGLILYFILRDPLPVPCPACTAPAKKGQTYCSRCGTAVRPACPACRRPVEPGWRNCTSCGETLAATSAAARS